MNQTMHQEKILHTTNSSRNYHVVMGTISIFIELDVQTFILL